MPLEGLAAADAYQDLGLDRRAALWAIKGLRSDVLPLFAAADQGRMPQPELIEPVARRWRQAAMLSRIIGRSD
jgi:error-prone DNA polymerase